MKYKCGQKTMSLMDLAGFAKTLRMLDLPETEPQLNTTLDKYCSILSFHRIENMCFLFVQNFALCAVLFC